jgi:hypothetical protein
MPKEVFKNQAGDEHAEVRWYNVPDKSEGTYTIPVVAIGAGQTKKFAVGGEEFEYETMYFNFETPEQIDEYIKALRRAKKKVFG